MPEVEHPLATPNNDLALKPGQDLVLRDSHGSERLRLDAATGTIRIRTAEGHTHIRMDGDGANLFIGGFANDGDLLIFPQSSASHEPRFASIHINGNSSAVVVGNDTLAGTMRVQGDGHKVEVTGTDGSVTLSGRLEVRTMGGALIARIDANGGLLVGGGGQGGSLHLRSTNADSTIIMDGAHAAGRFGGNGENGRIELTDAADVSTIVLNGATGNLGLGATQGGNAGALFIKDESGADILVFNGSTGSVGLGREGHEGNVFVKNEQGQNTIHLSGRTGDILLSNADCAEDFDIKDSQDVTPGTVMVIGDQEQLERCRIPYDRRVAGVLSGAGNLRPGIVLGKRPTSHVRLPLALVGKVFCKVDARYGSIDIGDLLTTSATPGHAMKAQDRDASFGAVLGKALCPWSEGVGLIPVLIALQ
jgi:hypothetical protein